jgi:hypothetical protein
LSLGRSDAGDIAPSGSCGHQPAASLSAAPLYSPGAMSVAPRGVYIALLPPVIPPPGTLGLTYQRQSWLIPASKHPRIAMLDVRAPAGATSVRVFTTYQHREEDEIEGFQDLQDPCVWHFETKPLLPGIPHVYRVESDGAAGSDWRMVRLIRGRRVTLEF